MSSRCELKDLEEDEDLHNKLKSFDQTIISDEQITVDNAKISTLETIIPEENSKVSCVITEEIDTLEKLSPRFPRFSEVTPICSEKQLAEYRDINKAVLLSFLGTPDTWEIHDSQEQKCAQLRDEGVIIFRTISRNKQVCPAVCQSEW